MRREAILLWRRLIIRVEQEHKMAAWAQQYSCDVQQVFMQLAEIEVFCLSVALLHVRLVTRVIYFRSGPISILFKASANFFTPSSDTVRWVADDCIEDGSYG